MIDECTKELTGVVVRQGNFFNSSTKTLNPTDAQNACSSYWDHDTFSDIAWLIAGIRTRFSTKLHDGGY